MTPTLDEIKKKMQRQLDKGQNCEKTNGIYRKLLKDANYYQNQFKVKDHKK